MLALKAQKRAIFGRKLNTSRKTGNVPGILYGKQVGNPVPVFVEELQFSRVLAEAGESTIINLQVEADKGGEKKVFPVLIFAIQREALSLRPLHVDFYQLPLDEKIRVRVPLEFIGKAPAVELGGTLGRHIQEVEVEALPLQLPREIEVDVSGLNTFEDAIKISDLNLPEGVEIIGREGDDVVAQVAEFQEEKIEEELAAPAEEAVGEVELSEERGKKEEEGEEGGAQEEKTE